MMAVALRSPGRIAREMLIACATLLVQECGLSKASDTGSQLFLALTGDDTRSCMRRKAQAVNKKPRRSGASAGKIRGLRTPTVTSCFHGWSASSVEAV